jgi:23S rRNA (uracil1939-C5)-methyltransferase
VCVDGFDREITIALRSELAMLAEQAGWARLTASGQEIVVRHLPQLVEGDVRVVPPPGAFVQAAGEAERVMQEIATRAATGAKRVLDLFAGIGTLTFPLARAARVLAVDSDRAALEALEAAVRGAQGLKPVEVRQRDLLLEPFARKELEPFDCVVFDPPRAGAKAQAEMIAKSVVPVVVAVSCNPATLARDLRCLVDGGYTIEKVVPVDQFVFSHHVEVIVVLRREKTRKRR